MAKTCEHCDSPSTCTHCVPVDKEFLASCELMGEYPEPKEVANVATTPKPPCAGCDADADCSKCN